MRLLFIGDTHAGARKGLNPRTAFDRFTSPYQEWVLYAWENHFIPNFREPDYLCLLGDIVDGAGHKNSVELVTTDVDLQVKFAEELLTPLIGSNTKVFGLRGSGYHDGKGSGFSGDYNVVEALGGNWCPDKYGIILSEYGENILCYHKAKNIKTELNKLQCNIFKHPNYIRPTRVVLAHKHSYEEYSDGAVRIYHTPCWEYLTSFMEGLGTYPDIGALQLRFDSNGKSTDLIKYDIPTEVFQGMDSWIGQLPKIAKEIEDTKQIRELKCLEEMLNEAIPAQVAILKKLEEMKQNIVPMELPEDMIGQGDWSKYKAGM